MPAPAPPPAALAGPPISAPTPQQPPPPPISTGGADNSIEGALAIAEQRAVTLAAENAQLLSRLHAAEQQAAAARASAPPAAAAASAVVGGGVGGGTADAEQRLAAVSAVLWEGAQRVAALAIERQQLLERCTRAEAAASLAQETCEKLARQVSAACGAGEMTADGPTGNGDRPAGATRSGAAATAATPAAMSTPHLSGSGAAIYGALHMTPGCASSMSRDELVQRGRSLFEARLRAGAVQGSGATATPGT